MEQYMLFHSNFYMLSLLMLLLSNFSIIVALPILLRTKPEFTVVLENFCHIGSSKTLMLLICLYP